jgi:hypothetical protein
VTSIWPLEFYCESKIFEKIIVRSLVLCCTTLSAPTEQGITIWRIYAPISFHVVYKGPDKSLALPTSRCNFFDSENISFDASLVIYIYNSTNIPPIMIINRT